MPFIPELPLAVNHALLLGVLLAVGAVCGELAQRLRLPGVTGYLVAGLAIGPIALELPVEPLIVQARIIVDVALGFVLFELGRRLDLQWLRRDPSLWVASVLEMALAFAAMTGALIAFGFPGAQAAVAAAIGIATSPAVVWLVTRDARAEGQITERVLSLTAVNSLVALLATTVLLGAVHMEHKAGWTAIVLHPVYLLLGSLTLGAGTGFALVAAGRFLGKRSDVQFGITVAAVLVSVGLAAALKLSVLIALLAAGATVRNAPARFALLDLDPGPAARVLYILLFVITGASLPLAGLGFAAVEAAGWAAGAYILARIAGKWTGVMVSAPFSPLPWRRSALLGAALMPMSGVAIVLMHDIAALFPDFGRSLAPVLAIAIVAFELAGPLVLHWSLRAAGDVR